MNEVKIALIEQLQHLQSLMHRSALHPYKSKGKSYNPYRGQGRVLAILKMKPEISQKDLSYLLNMSKQSLAELLVKLEKSEYITREPSEKDKRVMTVKLTEHGWKAAENVDDITFEVSKPFDCLNEDELKLFSEYTERVIKRYEELFPDEDFEQRRKMMEKFVNNHGCKKAYHSGTGKGKGHYHSRNWRKER